MSEPTALQPRPVEIVLVGNGPSVLASKAGEIVDRFPNIVRFNGFQTTGFEAHVGTRTTIWSRWYALPVSRAAEDFERIWINMPTHERTEEKMKIALSMLGRHKDRAEFIPSARVASAVHDELFAGNKEASKWPSSGLLAIAHCLSEGMTVSLLGFDSWAKEPFHYFEEHDRTHTHHVAQLERMYISNLVRTGRVRVLQ